jgi:hypothetical protein
MTRNDKSVCWVLDQRARDGLVNGGLPGGKSKGGLVHPAVDQVGGIRIGVGVVNRDGTVLACEINKHVRESKCASACPAISSCSKRKGSRRAQGATFTYKTTAFRL